MPLGPRKSSRAYRTRKPFRGVETTYFTDECGVTYALSGMTLFAASAQMCGQYSVKEGTKRIHCKAFTNIQGLKEIILPKSLKKIDKDAFCWLDIETVRIKSPLCIVHPDSFHSCPQLRTVYVPQGSVDFYLTRCPQWKGMIVEGGE